MHIHSSTHQLLTQLHPHTLNKLNLKNTIQQLTNKIKFTKQNINFHLNFNIFTKHLNNITTITLYQIIQKLLNNIYKHTQTSSIQLNIIPKKKFNIKLQNNNINLPNN